MKKFAFIKEISTCLIILGVIAISYKCHSQTILIDSTFTQDCEFFPFTSLETITSLTLDANIVLNNDTSLVRVVLETDDNIDYLIYEAYPLIVETYDIEVTGACDETCFLDEIKPVACKVYLIDATIKINALHYSSTYSENLLSEQIKRKLQNDTLKSQTMNSKIDDFNMHWQSGVNSLVQMMYNDKKDSYGNKYNFRGWDYYHGGIFELLGHRNYMPESTLLTKSFDWRSRHGANNPIPGYYYDYDELGTGWITNVRDQNPCAACWAFSANGAVESLFNLINNSHLDFSLSVKEYLCYNPPVGDCDGDFIEDALDHLVLHGVPTEFCYKYGNPLDCSNRCNPVDSIFKIESKEQIDALDNDEIKTALIQKGPLSVGLPHLSHAMVLNGYTFENERTIWIFKNSYGSNWGNHGFCYFADYQNIMDEIFAINTPKLFVNNIIQNINPEAYDYDGDGFCNWGLGTAPSDPPACLLQPEDCDDSNPYLGPYDEEFNCTCLLEFDPEVEYIDYEGHWDSDDGIDHIVDIKSGWSLEITSSIYFGPGTKIIIEPGARLIINGGRLTKACNELWEGIEVCGNPLLRQTPENQGMIEITNGGTVEFAKTAIITGRKNNGTIIEGYEGGIIIAENALFRNNEYDIWMLPYQDITVVPPYEIPNRSSFKECIFKTDATLYEYSYPLAHNRFEGIQGVQIIGCEFKNDVGFKYWTVNKLGIGIESFNSTFNLQEYCSSSIIPCPEVDVISCRFEGLNYGIRAFNWMNNNNLSIKNVEFIHNIVGMYLSCVNNVEILQNKFKCLIGTETEYLGKFVGAIYLDGCTGYKVEENSIYDPYPNLTGDINTSIGIYIRNSGENDNEIYKNTIQGRYIAIQAEGINRGERTGLCLKCNRLSENINDFVVSPDQRIHSQSWGIKGLQGTFEELPDAPAGNEFNIFSAGGSNNNGNLSNWNYYNDADNVTYVHHVNEPPIFRPGDNNYYSDNTFRRHQSTIDYDENFSCPSHIQNPIYKNYYDPRLAMENASTLAALYQTLLDTLIDGGDTYSLNQDILTGLPEESLELYQLLLNESPYLSDTVLKSSIYKENVLPNAMIRDIMVHNPQTAKSNEFINLLDYRTVPMSDTMMYEILEGQNILGSKEILESHLSYWNEKKAFARNDLIRLWLSDTTIFHPYDSLIELYQNENEIDSRYKLASCYFNKNQISQAITALQLIPAEFQLTEEQDSVYQDYLAYYSILKMMNDSSINIYELDSFSINMLLQILDHGFNQVSGYARSLLVNGNYIRFYENVASVGECKSSRIPVSGYKKPYNNINDHFKVFPNPSTDYIIVDFNTLSLNSYGEIIIVDLIGKICKKIPLVKYQDQIVINLENLASGTYTVMLWIDHKLIESEKLIKVIE